MRNNWLTYFALILFALMGFSEPVMGADLTFDNDSGDNTWLNADNWAKNNGKSPKKPPKQNDTAIIAGGIAVVDGDAVAGELRMEGTVADKVQVNAGGVLTVDRVVLGSMFGTGGTLEVDGGSLTVSTDLWIGDQPGSEGTVSLVNGSITLGAGVATVPVGNGLGNTGRINISGGSMVAASSTIELGVGGGTGNLVMDGGTLQVDALDADGGTANIFLNAGELTINDGTAGGFLYGPSTLLSLEQGVLNWNGIGTVIQDLVDTGRITWGNGYAADYYGGASGSYLSYANATDVLYIDTATSRIWVENLVAIPEPATLSMIAILCTATVWLRRTHRYR